MAFDPDAPLPPPGRVALLGVPLAAGACAALVLATDSNVALFHAVNAWGPATSDTFWSNITVLGEGAAVLSLGALLVGRRRSATWTLLVGALLATLALHALKELTDVPRPARVLADEAIHVVGQALHKRSFPSGHATTVFAAAAFAWALLPWAGARLLALAAATLVALSRIVVGAHWPLDVLCGAALGWLGTGAALHLVARRRPPPDSRWHLVAAVLPALAAVRLVVAPENGARLTPTHVTLAAIGLLACLAGWSRLLSRRRAE
jgi:membrane-associated phospholipid phosphatase